MRRQGLGTTIGRSRKAYLLLTAFAWWALGCSPPAPEPAPPAADPAPEADSQRPVVLFLGTSLTAGYGLPAEQAFPALIQQRIDEAGTGYEVVNAGVSGDTSAGGLRRIDWLLRQPIAVLVLELGGNDMLRGLDVPAMQANLGEIIERTRAAHPRALPARRQPGRIRAAAPIPAQRRLAPWWGVPCGRSHVLASVACAPCPK